MSLKISMMSFNENVMIALFIKGIDLCLFIYLVSQSVSQSVRRSVSQSVSKSVGRSVGRSVS